MKDIVKALLVLVCSVVFFNVGMNVAQTAAKEYSLMGKIMVASNTKVTDSNYERVTIEQVEKIASLEEVQAVEYQLDIKLSNADLKIPHENPTHEMVATGIAHANFSLLKEEFISLKAGRSFNDEELNNTTFDKVPVLISEEFAELNQLTTGSNFSLDHNVYFVPLAYDNSEFKSDKKSQLITKKTYEFEVIGIFHQNKINDIQLTKYSNHIFIPEPVVEEASTFYFTNAHQAHQKAYQHESWWAKFEADYQFHAHNLKASTPLFLLKDYSNWETFEAKANEILAPSHQIQRVKTLGDIVHR